MMHRPREFVMKGPAWLRTLSFITLLIAAFFSANAPAHAQSTPPSKVDKAPLTIAITDNYPPFTIVGPGGQAYGLFVDMWKLWSETTGTPVEFRVSNWAETLEAVKSGAADVHSGLYRTRQREAYMAFSDPIHVARTSLHFRAGDSAAVPLADLAGQKVGVISKTYQDTYLQEGHPGVVRVAFDDSGEMIKTLLRGELRAVLSETVSIQSSLSQLGLRGVFQRGGETLLSNFVHAGVEKGNSALLEQIDAGFRAIPKVKMTEIEERWLPDPYDHFYEHDQSRIRLTTAETAWLQGNPLIRLAVSTFIKPIDIVDSEGGYSGMNADLMALLSKRIGVAVSPEFFSKWDEIVNAAVAGDVAGALSFSITPERQEHLSFTKPYSHDPNIIVARADSKDISSRLDIAGRRVSAVKGMAWIDDIKADIGDGELVIVDDEHAALEKLTSGEVDAHFSSLVLFGNAQKASYVQGLKIVGSRNTEGGALRIAVHKSKPILFNIIDKALNSLTQEELAALRDRWLTPKQPNPEAVLLTAKESQWLRENPVVDIAMMDAWPPISYVDALGRPQGISVALVDALNNKLGGILRLRPGQWKDNLAAVKERRMPALFDITPMPKRREHFNFTTPYLRIPHIFVARTSAAYISSETDLAGKTLALEKGFGNVRWFRDNHPNITIKEYFDTSTALDAVSRGEADAYAGNRAVAMHIIERELIGNLKAHGRIGKPPVVLAIGTRKDWPILRNILQKGLAALGPEERRSIFQQAAPEKEQSPAIALTLSDKEQAWLKAQRGAPVRVMAGTWPPFHFVENDKPQGLALDYVSWALQTVGLVPEFVSIEWSEALESISRQEAIDVLPTVARSPEREKLVHITNNYLSYPRVIFSRNKEPYPALSALAGKTVAVEKNFISHKLLAADHPEINLLLVATTRAALEAVSFGKADAFVSNLAVGTYLTDKLHLSNVRVTGQTDYRFDNQGMGVRKDWPELASILNKTLAVMPPEVSASLREKWIRKGSARSVEIIGLSDVEQRWLSEHPVLRVHNEINWAPFNFFEGNQPKGFSIDYMNLLAEKIGVTVEYMTGPTWGQFLEKLRNKSLDVMLNIVKTPEREKYILFTPPYVDNPVAIIAPTSSSIRSFGDLQGRSLCVPKGFFYQELMQAHHPNVSLVLAQDQVDCLKKVAAGSADATMGGIAVQLHLMSKLFLTNLHIAGYVNDDKFVNKLRIGVRDDWGVLRTILEKAIGSVTEEEVAPIRARWMSASNQGAQSEGGSTDVYTLIFIVAGVAVGLIILLALVREGMRRLTKRDASELYESREIKGTALLLVGIFLAVVVLVAWATAWKTESDVRADVGRNLQTVLNTTHEALRTWASGEVRVIETIASEPDLREAVKDLLLMPRDGASLRGSPEQAALRQWFAGRFTKGEIQGFFIISPDMINIGSRRNENLGERNLIALQRTDLLQRAFQGKTQFIPPLRSDVAIRENGTTKDPTMFFATPIRNRAGKVIAVLTLRHDPSKNFTRISQLGNIGQSGETYAIDRNGRMVTGSRFDDELRSLGLIASDATGILNLLVRDPGGNMLKGHPLSESVKDLPPTVMAENALTGSPGLNVEGYRDYRGVTVFGAWLWDSDLNIAVATEINEDEAMASFWTLRLTMMMVLGVTVMTALALTGLSVWVGQSANRSLRKARDHLETQVQERTQELQDSETKIRAIIDNAVDGIITIDEIGTVQTMSPAAQMMFLYTADEVIGNNIKMLMPERYSREHDGYLRRFIDTGEAQIVGSNREVVGLRKNGSEFPMDLAVGETFLGEDRIFTGIVRDITERKKAEEELAESENRTRLILESVGDGIFGVDMEGKVSFVNPQALNMLGFAEDDLLGQSIHKLIHHTRSDGSDYPVEECPMWRAYTDGVAARIDDEVLWRQDGTSFPVEYNATPILQGDELVGAVISFHDISDLMEKEAQLRTAMNNMTDGIYMLDKDMRYALFNDRYKELVDLPSDVIAVGRAVKDAVRNHVQRGDYGPGDEDTLVAERLERLSNETAGQLEMVINDGERHLELKKAPIEGGGAVVVVTDATRRTIAQRELADAMDVISDSIDYASYIQRSILPPSSMFESIFSDHFVIWQPRDVVGGDMYWCRMWGDGILVLLGDCTGHGVPGAFMTLIAAGALDRAQTEVPAGQVGELLQRMHQYIQTTLGQHGDRGQSDDGLELGACYLNPEMTHVAFSGARFSLFHSDGDTVEEIKGTKKGLGYRGIPLDQTYDTETVAIQAERSFYMTSDGLIDQVGGPRRRGYGKRRLKELMLALQGTTMSNQKGRIIDALRDYQGSESRRDDVSVLGFKL